MKNVIKWTAAGVLIGFVLVFVVPTFMRARLTKSENACINNLRLIDSAKQQWALEYRKHGSDTPVLSDLKPYLGHGPTGELPHCPLGGTYIVGRVDENPKCSIGASAWPNDHVFPGNNSAIGWWTDFKAAYGILLSR